MSVYFFEVINKATDTVLAQLHGDIDTVSYVARKLSLAAEEDYKIVLNEVEEIGGEAKRAVASLSADGELALLGLGKKLRAERKAQAAGAAETEAAAE